MVMKKDDVVKLLAREVGKAASRRQWARATGISSVYVDDVLNGRREPGKAILDALGLVRVVTYRRKP